jgi:hypothetical protein
MIPNMLRPSTITSRVFGIVFLPKRSSQLPAIIVELKWNKGAGGAVAQIREKNYPRILENYGGDIVLVGVNYDENTKNHECVIERYSKL